MTKCVTPNPKLKTYSTLAATLLAGAGATDAAIVYKDVTPDVTKTQTTVGTSSYDIDINSDNTTDFVLSINQYNGTYAGVGVTISPVYPNKVATNAAGNSYVVALNANDSVKTSLHWYGGSAALLAGKITYPSVSTRGNFGNVSDKYIGIQFTSGGNVHYGWIRLDVGDYNTFTIKDMAYQDTPGKGVKVGQQTISGIDNGFINQITKISTLPHSILAEFSSQVQGSVRVINNQGTMVRAYDINGMSCSTPTQGLPAGLYHIYFSTNEGELSRKVLID